MSIDRVFDYPVKTDVVIIPVKDFSELCSVACDKCVEGRTHDCDECYVHEVMIKSKII